MIREYVELINVLTGIYSSPERVIGFFTYLVKPQFKTNSNKEKLIGNLKYETVQQFSKKVTLL